MPPIFLFMNFATIKNYLIVLLALIIAVLAILRSCENTSYQKKLAKCSESKKEITHDTAYILVPQQAALAETIIKTKETKPTKAQVDSFIAYQVIEDTANAAKWKEAYYNLAAIFNTENEYADTAIFKNGIAIVNSRVKRNELQEQKTILDSIRQDIITNTIVQTKYKDRTQLFLGIEAFGDKHELINAAGFNALLKLKSNIGFESGIYFNSQNQQFYKAGFKFLIRLKKP